MSKPSRVSVSINFGRQDKIAPKHAPFGVLKSCKNMRHREQGGLGMRNGYQLAGNSTITGTLVAHDLHEFQGRLLALGSDQLEGYPHDVLEYTNLANAAWRSAQGTGNRFAVSPFTNAREVCGVPQIEGGVSGSSGPDACSGGGYTMLVYTSAQNTHTYAQIVDSRTNQSVHFEDVSNGAFGGLVTLTRAAFAGGKFFIQAARADNSLRIISFQVGVSSSFAAFVTVDAASGTAISAHDLVPVTNASTALLCSAFDRGTATNLSILVYQSNGTQLGSTLTVATTNTTSIALDADQTDNTILLGTIETSTNALLRTFSFSALIAGPLTVTAGLRMSIARRHPGAGTDIAYIASQSSNDIVVQQVNVDTLSSFAVIQTLFNAIMMTRLFNLQGPTASLVIGGAIGQGTGITGALFHVGGAVHTMVRDYVSFNDPFFPILQTLTYDATIGSLCWCAVSVLRGQTGNPFQLSTTLVDYRSTARIQATTYGGLRYFAGATPWIYDGRSASEVGFLEPPTIVSVTTSSAGGSLTASAKYTYVAHWEVTFADGSFIESAPSLPFPVSTGVADNRATLVVTGPHSLHTSLGLTSLGASVTLVISRTEWSPTTLDPVSLILGAQFSVFRRSVQVDLIADISFYGKSVTVIDQTSDVLLAARGAIYTQADRGEFSGPVEHNAIEGCSYIAAGSSRIISGGLVRPFEVQASLESFLGQPFTWSFLSSFYAQASKSVTGVFSLGNTRIIFTADEVYGLGPNAPDDEGKGSLDLPVRIPSPGGLKDWRSLSEEPDGLWFQLDDDKLFKLPIGGFAQGVPTWAGANVQLLLAALPTITAATRHKGDNVSLFACNNAALTTAQIAVHDMLFDSWLTDSPPLQASKGIEAMVGFGRTVAYLSGGVAYKQTTGFTDLTSSFIDCELELQPIYPFEVGGYGLIFEIVVTAEYRGDCVLTVNASYDDGLTYPFSQAFTISGLTTGATVRKKWTLPQDQTDRIMLKLDVNTNGAPSEGLIINEVTIYGQDQGGSPELPPGDEA